MLPKIKKLAGFTLIELVVAMVIGAILAAIAIPAYSNYVRQSRRTDAKTALLDLASLEERYFSVNNAYTTSATNLGYAAFPVTVGSGYYSVAQPTVTAAAVGTVATFTATATVIATTDQAKDTQCQSFTITSNGAQTATPDPTNTCWH